MENVKSKVLSNLADLVAFLNTVDVTEVVTIMPADGSCYVIIYK
jgi:hypothetical protein